MIKPSSTAIATMVLRLDRPGAGPIGFDLVNLAATTNTPLVGSTLGSSACSLVFAEGSPAFSSAAAPYNGTFAPFGDAGNGTFSLYKGKPANGNYGLYAAFLQDSITFTCFTLELDVE